MGKYSVTVSKNETMTLEVEATDASDATDEALTLASDDWDSDTVNWQVDDVAEVAT